MQSRELYRYFEKVYEREHEQRHRLERLDGVLISLAAGALGVGAVFLQRFFEPLHPLVVGVVYRIIAGCYFFSVVGAMYQLGRSIWPRDVAFTASPKDWLEHAELLERYTKQTESPNKHAQSIVSRFEDLFIEDAIEQYARISAVNRKSALAKGWHQTRAKAFIIASMIFLLAGRALLTKSMRRGAYRG